MDKSPAVSKRKDMYKVSTPPWKETYRKRCQDRLKRSRGKFMDRFRHGMSGLVDQAQGSVVTDLMLEEWKTLRSEQQGLPSMDHDGQSTHTKDNFDDALTIFEEIRADLIREEQQILAEYEAGERFDEAALCASLDSSQEVVCPVCQRNPLMTNKGIIFCRCGTRVDTEQDCVSLDYVKHNIEEGLSVHSGACAHQAGFGVVNQVGIDNLLMTCSACDFMFIII